MCPLVSTDCVGDRGCRSGIHRVNRSSRSRGVREAMVRPILWRVFGGCETHIVSFPGMWIMKWRIVVRSSGVRRTSWHSEYNRSVLKSSC